MTDRMIRKEVLVPAPPSLMWDAWTTHDGVTSFFAPQATVDLAIGGRYEMLFDLDAPAGSQGGEGLRILSYVPGEMLSFEWNAPPAFPEIRNQKTWVVVQMEDTGTTGTRVTLTHLGWGEGQHWNQVYDYFTHAWDIVLGRLKHCFEVEPVDWDSPFRPDPG